MTRGRDRLVIATYIVAFSVATIFHAIDIARYGWLPYRFAPDFLNGFWTALTFLDPLVIALLLSGWRRCGLGLALAIMIADVAANSYALYGLGFPEFAASLQVQTAFLGFVAGSIMFVWPANEKPGALG